MKRRELLRGVGGALGVAGLSGCARAVCPETLPAIIGPFPPAQILETLDGGPNPGVRRDSAENDLDLALLEGAGVAPQGQVVRVRGQVVGPDCAPLAGARIQLWQADAGGRYNHHNERRSVTAADYDPGFGYWGEALADGEGRFTARTVVPGSYKAAEGWWRPPHLHWRVTHGDRPEVITQSWFEGEALEGIDRIRELNAADWILNLEGGYARGLTGQALAGAKARMLEELVVRFAAGAGGPEGALVLRMS